MRVRRAAVGGGGDVVSPWANNSGFSTRMRSEDASSAQPILDGTRRVPVELRRIELLTSSVPRKRSTN